MHGHMNVKFIYPVFDPTWALCLYYVCCGMCGSQMETVGSQT